MRVSIIGTGYVGLISGVCLAEKGHQVICVDVDRTKVDKINRCLAPFYEKDLEEYLQRHVNVDLWATSNLMESVIESDLSLITVGTPFNGSSIDLTYIKQAALEIGKGLKHKSDYHMVAVKSTVIPGTTDDVVRPLLEKGSGKRAGVDFGVGMNPEFLREGNAIQDFMFPDRVVLGGMDQRSIDILDDLYSVFPNVDILRTNNKTAEMIKYASNSLLATMISFSNEIGNLCASTGMVDVVDVLKGVHMDKRLCPVLPNGDRIVPSFTKYLEAGCGFGGSCFSKDVKALIAHGDRIGTPMKLLNSVIQINEQQPYRVLSLVKKHFPSLTKVRIAVLGLAFKPETDDMRGSPAIPVVESLLEQGAEVRAYDPAARDEASKLFNHPNFSLSSNLHEAIEDAEVILLLTSWEEFQDIPKLLAPLDTQPLVVDGRRMLKKYDLARYEAIGL